MFSHLIYFTKECYKCCTFNAICKEFEENSVGWACGFDGVIMNAHRILLGISLGKIPPGE
jgi:hypothetical protein